MYSFSYKKQRKPTSLNMDQPTEDKDPVFAGLDQLVQLWDYGNPKAIQAVREDLNPHYDPLFTASYDY